MEKEIRAVFKLSYKEIQESFYDFYVKKLKSNNINAFFSEENIEIKFEDDLEVSLVIIENIVIE